MMFVTQARQRYVAFLSILLIGMLCIWQTAHAASICDVAIPTVPNTVQLTSSLPQTVPSATVGFTVEVQPVNDTLFLAVSIQDAERAIVDRFVIPVASENPTTFSWRVPNDLSTGDYAVSAVISPAVVPYASVFADETLPRDTVSLAVRAERDNATDFANSVTLGASGVEGEIYTKVSNKTDEPLRGVIEWRVWSAISSANSEPLFSQRDEVKVHPQTSNSSAAFTLPKAAIQGEYYAEARFIQDDMTLFVTHGWVVDGVFQSAKPCGGAAIVPEVSDSMRNILAIVGIIAVALVLGGLYRRNRKQYVS